VIYAPGAAINRFFSEVGEPAQVREVPPPSESPPDFERLIAASERYGIQMQASADH
jgi:hypothetical protein